MHFALMYGTACGLGLSFYANTTDKKRVDCKNCLRAIGERRKQEGK